MRGPWARRALVAAALASALGYHLAGRLGESDGVGLKALSVLALAALALTARGAVGSRLLGASLVAHSAGDVLLEVGPILAGMGAFAAGHLGYARLFSGARRPWHEVGAAAKVRLGLLALAGAGLISYLAPRLEGALRVAVPTYALLLLAMAALAQVSMRGAPWVAAGALLFVASDALLALDLFAGPHPWTRHVVWPTYWTAQAAIALGWLGRNE